MIKIYILKKLIKFFIFNYKIEIMTKVIYNNDRLSNGQVDNIFLKNYIRVEICLHIDCAKKWKYISIQLYYYQLRFCRNNLSNKWPIIRYSF